MVSSPAPRLGRRCPPVRATLVTSASRISAASAGIWSAGSAFRSSGLWSDRRSDTRGCVLSVGGRSGVATAADPLYPRFPPPSGRPPGLNAGPHPRPPPPPPHRPAPPLTPP